MRVAIHQPHYFPWEGYLNKIASADKFILMDDVQLTDSSFMYRHKLLSIKGEGKYITIPFDKVGYKHIPYRDIRINNQIDWKNRQLNFVKENYRKSVFHDEVYGLIQDILERPYTFLCELTIDTINVLINLFDIKTELILQSDLNYPEDSKKNDLLLELCKSVRADAYLSGKGGKGYMDLHIFRDNNICVDFQNFEQTEYKQLNSFHFVPGLCILDMLFSIGIERSVELFKHNLNV